MRSRVILLALTILMCVSLAGCSRSTPEETLRQFPAKNLDGVLSRSGVSFDAETSSDGNGSIRIVAQEPTTVRLYETGDIDVENARLAYRAHLRTQDVKGQVYLEMWCHCPGGGEFFSRALQSPVTGTTEWVTQETPFMLQAGQNPDNVKLNLVVDGSGTVWIDDIKLVKGQLP